MNHLKYNINVLKQRSSYKKRKISVNTIPKVIAIEPTNACPMRCGMCPRQFMTRPIGFMKLDLFKSIIDQTKGTTNYIGLELFGDSLLHPEIDKMVNYMHKKGIVSQISTNPVSLNEAVIEKIVNSKLDILLLSLDGMDDTTYKKHRGPAADYDKAVRMIHKLLAAKKGKTPYITIRMLDMPGLGEQFPMFKKLWTLPGVDQVSLGAFHTYGNTIKGGTARIKECVCYKPWEGVSVTWDGKVVPCCYDFNNECVLGDLNTQSLEEVWNGPAYQRLRQECCTGKFTNKLCARCKEKYPGRTFIQEFIDYNYQRNQHKGIVKKLKKMVKR